MSHHAPSASVTSTGSGSSNTNYLHLVQTALDSYHREPRSDQQPGLTIDLSHQRISFISQEMIDLVKDEIERLALAHNRLSAFPESFSHLGRLRYLNLRANQIRDFPISLCQLPALEILDISRNHLTALPVDFGQLMSLKVLSVSKNSIVELPTYIGDMTELKILKIDHNPIRFPPRDVLDLVGEGEDFRDVRLDVIKNYLRTAESDNATAIESDSSDDFNNDYAQLTVKPYPTMSSGQRSPPPIPIRSQQRSLSQRDVRRGQSITPNHEGASSFSSSSSSLINVPTSNNAQSSHERSRSNSETSSQQSRNKRMGNVFPRGEKLGTVDEAKPSKHQHMRGYSHDSIIENQHRSSSLEGNNDQSSSRSPTEPDRATAGHYFRRLSSLPEQKRSSMSAVRAAESARGILYALSQAHSAISIFTTHSGDRQKHGSLERVLFNANIHVGYLVRALEKHDANGDETAIEPVLNACSTCLGAFRHVISLLQASLRELSIESDIRLTRTLLLMIYGSAVELQNSWASLRPILPVPTGNQAPSYFSRQMATSLPHSRLRSLTSTVTRDVPPALGTPRSPDASFQIPSTPSISSALYSDGVPDNDEPFFNEVSTATTAALSTLPQITDASSAVAAAKSLPPNTMLKMKELEVLCSNTKEVAYRLQSRLESIREYIREGNILERRRFWEDTNLFIKAIIDIAEICRVIKSEHPFPSHVTNNISSLIRSTKSLSILHAVCSFRQFREEQYALPANQYNASLTPFYQPVNQQLLSATPLSAALGAAAQATVPSYVPSASTTSLSNGLDSRTETMLSSARTMTATSTNTGFVANLGPLSPTNKDIKPSTNRLNM